MTLLIALLLLYHYDMPWWWYVITAGVWIWHCMLNPVIRAFLDN